MAVSGNVWNFSSTSLMKPKESPAPVVVVAASVPGNAAAAPSVVKAASKGKNSVASDFNDLNSWPSLGAAKKDGSDPQSPRRKKETIPSGSKTPPATSTTPPLVAEQVEAAPTPNTSATIPTATATSPRSPKPATEDQAPPPAPPAVPAATPAAAPEVTKEVTSPRVKAHRSTASSSEKDKQMEDGKADGQKGNKKNRGKADKKQKWIPLPLDPEPRNKGGRDRDRDRGRNASGGGRVRDSRPARDSEREMNWRDVPRSTGSEPAKRPERPRGDGRNSRETLTKGKGNTISSSH
ncbi:uncharacterized protein LOC115922186 isoform X5 [Strongylocentrotus purpuratus]|uniref:Uncharacterized protein n=1 Tax=Strongylocentrotus purpuratus TaxID=7668 RepID=A0A7M7NGQ3_STRPU|nr:uncharacterized protein LOC115922186 isoform X5 [Strongylocentrotus purpuratus]